MTANGLAIGKDFSPIVVPGKGASGDKNTPDNISEKTSNAMSQVGEAIRRNIEINREVLEKGIEEINQNIRIFNIKLSFYIDEPTGRTVIKVSNSETDEVIREIPPIEFLKMAAKLNEILGVIIDQKV